MRVTIVLATLVACSSTSQPSGSDAAPNVEAPTQRGEPPAASTTKPQGEPPMTECTATDGRISVSANIDAASHFDRIPWRRMRMIVKNVSAEPVRLLRIRPDAFRYMTSTIMIAAGGADRIFSPEPRPHGYLITEEDFALIEPGATIDLEQHFTIDPMARGSGTSTARTPGYAKGTVATVTWTLENSSTSFPGGVGTLDGVTKPLFGGREMPELWTGKLACRLQWTVPD